MGLPYDCIQRFACDPGLESSPATIASSDQFIDRFAEAALRGGDGRPATAWETGPIEAAARILHRDRRQRFQR